MKKKSKIDKLFVLFVVFSLLYIVCLSTKIVPSSLTNIVYAIYSFIFATYCFREWRKSRLFIDFICFILSSISAILVTLYLLKL